MSGTLVELEAACPAGARPAGEADRVDGVDVELVAYPRSAPEVAAALAVAARHALAVVARGAGTKLDWGYPPERAGLVLDLSHMSGVIEYTSDDLVVRVKAGTPLSDLAERLSGAGQRLAIDEVVPGSTAGGAVATGACGPLRHAYGAVRDRVLGMTVVRPDGVVARAGSKVVKNVAGYDLAKLFTGSYGTLGVLTELIFKLAPLPAARLFVSASYPGTAEVGPVLSALLRSQAAPEALELSRTLPASRVELCALVEGRQGPAEARAATVAAALSGGEVSPSAPSWWGCLPGPVTVKLTTVLSAIPDLAAQASEACAALGLTGTLRGSAGVGVLYLGLPAETERGAIATLLAELRRAVTAAEGHATLLRAPAATKAGLDIWGPVPGLELMHRVKERFDPGRLLAPGRFVGGI